MTAASGLGPPSSPAPRVVDVPQRRQLWQGLARGPAMPHASPVDRLARPAPRAARGAGASTASLMGRTPKSWVHMTAPVPVEVDRTFSEVGRYLTGLSGPETHEPGR